MNVWECDLVDVRALGKFNDKYVYILSAIDVFSKFLHKVPRIQDRYRSDVSVAVNFQGP